jgi:hypothetical protein
MELPLMREIFLVVLVAPQVKQAVVLEDQVVEAAVQQQARVLVMVAQEEMEKYVLDF